jgi:trans-2,3-dihydro-3-hydroxyanthranilate isomerase
MVMSRPRLFIADVFAEARYAGNQLAVVSDAESLSSDDMQRIAREMNFSETTFVMANTPIAGAYPVRIFTPTSEIPFAGHPTIGTAYVIREAIDPGSADRLVLRLGIGDVPVTFVSSPGRAGTVWMHPPRPELGAVHDPAPFARVVGLEPEDIDPRTPVQEVSIGLHFFFVPLRTLGALDRCRVNVTLRDAVLTNLPLRCLFLFCPEARERGHDLAARMFFEADGVREDPATGSANAGLAGYLLHHRYLSAGGVDITVEQGYQIGRPSLLYVRARSGESHVSVGGQVMITVRGELV